MDHKKQPLEDLTLLESGSEIFKGKLISAAIVLKFLDEVLSTH